MLLNYSTVVPASKSIGEISGLLVEHGAKRISQIIGGDRKVKGVEFEIEVREFPVQFALPANVDGCFGVLMREDPWHNRKGKTIEAYRAFMRERAEWVSWRTLCMWLRAQLAIIETGQVTMDQVMMPFAQIEVEGIRQPMYQQFLASAEQGRLRLGAGQ